MEKFAFTIEKIEISIGSPCGALTESKVDESWSGKIVNTSKHHKISRYYETDEISGRNNYFSTKSQRVCPNFFDTHYLDLDSITDQEQNIFQDHYWNF